MSLVRHCDKCGEPIDLEGPLSDQSWVSAAVSLDESATRGATRDYHRACARTVTLAEVWQREGLVAL